MDFASMKRADLQRLCRENGLKANGKTEQLIASLKELFAAKSAPATPRTPSASRIKTPAKTPGTAPKSRPVTSTPKQERTLSPARMEAAVASVNARLAAAAVEEVAVVDDEESEDEVTFIPSQYAAQLAKESAPATSQGVYMDDEPPTTEPSVAEPTAAEPPAAAQPAGSQPAQPTKTSGLPRPQSKLPAFRRAGAAAAGVSAPKTPVTPRAAIAAPTTPRTVCILRCEGRLDCAIPNAHELMQEIAVEQAARPSVPAASATVTATITATATATASAPSINTTFVASKSGPRPSVAKQGAAVALSRSMPAMPAVRPSASSTSIASSSAADSAYSGVSRLSSTISAASSSASLVARPAAQAKKTLVAAKKRTPPKAVKPATQQTKAQAKPAGIAPSTSLMSLPAAIPAPIPASIPASIPAATLPTLPADQPLAQASLLLDSPAAAKSFHCVVHGTRCEGASHAITLVGGVAMVGGIPFIVSLHAACVPAPAGQRDNLLCTECKGLNEEFLNALPSAAEPLPAVAVAAAPQPATVSATTPATAPASASQAMAASPTVSAAIAITSAPRSTAASKEQEVVEQQPASMSRMATPVRKERFESNELLRFALENAAEKENDRRLTFSLERKPTGTPQQRSTGSPSQLPSNAKPALPRTSSTSKISSKPSTPLSTRSITPNSATSTTKPKSLKEPQLKKSEVVVKEDTETVMRVESLLSTVKDENDLRSTTFATSRRVARSPQTRGWKQDAPAGAQTPTQRPAARRQTVLLG